MAEAVALPGTQAQPLIPDAAASPAAAPAPDAAAEAAAKAAAEKAATDAAAAAAAQAATKPIQFTTPETQPTPTPSTEQTVVYEKTGDAGLDVALQYVGQRGFGPDHPAMVAATKGDFSQLEAALTKLGDEKAPGAKAYVELAKQSYERKQSATKAEWAETTKVVHDAVGGASNWTAIQTWAQENADPAEKKQLNAAFAAGGFAAQAAAEKLAQLYQRAGGKPKPAVKDTATAVAATANGPLDGKAYGRAVADLYAKLGNKMQDSPEYRDLQARRRAHRG